MVPKPLGIHTIKSLFLAHMVFNWTFIVTSSLLCGSSEIQALSICPASHPKVVRVGEKYTVLPTSVNHCTVIHMASAQISLARAQSCALPSSKGIWENGPAVELKGLGWHKQECAPVVSATKKLPQIPTRCPLLMFFPISLHFPHRLCSTRH